MSSVRAPTLVPVTKFFTIIKSNVPLPVSGNGIITFNPTDFPVPANSGTHFTGTLNDLIRLVGEENISLRNYVRIQGMVATMGCPAIYSLHGSAVLQNGTSILNLKLVSTDPLSINSAVDSNWVAIGPETKSPLSQFVLTSTCQNHGSAIACQECPIEKSDGWKNTHIIFRIDVTATFSRFCQSANLICSNISTLPLTRQISPFVANLSNDDALSANLLLFVIFVIIAVIVILCFRNKIK